jgi:hypothetical protein
MAVYTTINDPSAQFQTLLYTGNASANRALTNDGNSDLQPDWIWIKNRDATQSYALFDSSRGATKRISSNLTNAESTENNNLDSFDSDGFTIDQEAIVNGNGNGMVAWQWKANGGTTATNNDGSHTSTVQANTTAGFSIVTYTGTGSGFTLGHGLGAAPEIIFNKGLSDSHSWIVGCTHDSANLSKVLVLNSSDASATATANFNAAPTSSVYTIGTAGGVNNNGQNYVSYLFRSVQGYSKIGVYTGNGNANGPFVYTGFKPAWVMFKDTSASAYWAIYDNKRDSFNPSDQVLAPNVSDAEDGSYNDIDLLSNGFKIRASGSPNNTSSRTYIYMAFAENPFTTSDGVPTTAR